MRTAKPKSVLERDAAADLWRHTLSQIPTLFGKMMYLGNLRDPNSGEYHHHGLALVFGDKEAEKALRRNHKQAFSEWLTLTLDRQYGDLESYLDECSEERLTILGNWELVERWRVAIPATVNAAEKNLFCSDMRNLLAAIKIRCAGDAARRTASRHH